MFILHPSVDIKGLCTLLRPINMINTSMHFKYEICLIKPVFIFSIAVTLKIDINIFAFRLEAKQFLGFFVCIPIFSLKFCRVEIFVITILDYMLSFIQKLSAIYIPCQLFLYYLYINKRIYFI